MKSRAFTLVEVLLTLTIGSMLMLCVVGSTRALSTAQKDAQSRADRLSEARRALQTIVGELRNVRRDPAREKPMIVGKHGIGPNSSDRIDAQVITGRAVRPDAQESDQSEVAFFLEQRGNSPLPSLMCRRDHALDEYPEDGGLVSVVAENIVGLMFEYRFGDEWKPAWPSTEPQPPQAVRVTLAAAMTRDRGDRRPPAMVELRSEVSIHAASAQENQAGKEKKGDTNNTNAAPPKGGSP